MTYLLSLWYAYHWFTMVKQVKCYCESLSTVFLYLVLGSNAWLPVTETFHDSRSSYSDTT